MSHKLSLLFLVMASAVVWNGCSDRYTRHMNESYKDKKIDSVTIGIAFMPQLDYRPPASCFGNGNPENGPKYRTEWETKTLKTLNESFKKQRFVSIPTQRLDELGIDAPSFFTAALVDIHNMGVSEYTPMGGEIRPMDYQPSRSGGQMHEWLAKLREKDSVDYVIILVEPKMTGETQTSYTQNGPVSSTSFTTNVRFGVWSSETGSLAYASGAISSSTGFCLFLSPQSAAIDGNSRDILDQLKSLITAFLNQLQKNQDGLRQASLPALR